MGHYNLMPMHMGPHYQHRFGHDHPNSYSKSLIQIPPDEWVRRSYQDGHGKMLIKIIYAGKLEI